MALTDEKIEKLRRHVLDMYSPVKELVVELLEDHIRVYSERNKFERAVLDVISVCRSRSNPQNNDPGTVNMSETILAMLGGERLK